MSTATDSRRPYIGVAVLVWHQGRILLGERINSQTGHCWQFPGGHLEYSEEVLVCARREVREETGLEIHQLKLATYSNEVFIDAQRHYVTLFVSAQLAAGSPEPKEPEKCARWQWFQPTGLPAPLFTPITDLLKTHPDLRALA